MTIEEIKAKFPHASPSFIRANLSIGRNVSDSEQLKCEKELARGDARKAQSSGLRHCRFTLVRKRLLDVDAKYASVKDLLDFLAVGRIIQGDKEGEITLEVNQRKKTKCEPEHTIIEVFENDFEKQRECRILEITKETNGTTTARD